MEDMIKGWPILLLLHYAKKISPHIKLQKMLFLCFSEAKMKVPYNFTKYEHGPYDPEIKIDFLNLGKDGYIDVKCFVGKDKKCWAFFITKKGEDYVRNVILKSLDSAGSKRVEVIVTKYEKTEWKEIVKMVYEKYNLNRQELELKKNWIRSELFRIRPLWEANYTENKCGHIFTSLAMIDYSIAMLGKKKFDAIDITQYNVLISFLLEMLNYLKTETTSISYCPEDFRCNKLPETEELFQFVQYLGEKFKILPATFNEEANLDDFEFENPDEGEGIRTAIKTP